jgi:SAM-dependent methyltransferase
VPWELFERAAPRYGDWYATSSGRRVSEAERALLTWLLALFSAARSVLEVGCGTDHFAEWLAERSLRVVGLDRSPTMLREMRAWRPDISAVLGDAHRLPYRDEALDLVVFVTALEFLEGPEVALTEAVRVARQSVILVALSRWSLGALSRRWGPKARRPLLGQARDCSPLALLRRVRQGAGGRLCGIHWTSALFPACLWRLCALIPAGDVIGMAAVLAPSADSAKGEIRPSPRIAPAGRTAG